MLVEFSRPGDRVWRIGWWSQRRVGQAVAPGRHADGTAPRLGLLSRLAPSRYGGVHSSPLSLPHTSYRHQFSSWWSCCLDATAHRLGGSCGELLSKEDGAGVCRLDCGYKGLEGWPCTVA
ncbi:unnamed protein product [Ostreobium quekettii]|uniref:Uncharacterized protein n=1 Tax=Ostreobium quekettii TaxID=121088 RepID=A0A8S1JCK6_9CHLO|nr:unnamed protein product [Ostreobium quekettii]